MTTSSETPLIGNGQMTAELCATCTWHKMLFTGHVGICFEQWRNLAWNEAVPLTKPNDRCEKWKARETTEESEQ